jgi:uncharacterized protein YndB with AHSA1/START domain
MSTVVVVERVLPAPPDVVFDEWVDPDALVEWMCPRPAHVTRAIVDARVGGEYRFELEDSGVSLTLRGRYLDLDRPNLLRFTWSSSLWPRETPESIVTVTLVGRDDGDTTMTIRHELLPPDTVASYDKGWARTAEQLEQNLTRS